MSTINSVPKIYRFGERWTHGILEGPVVIEEKYDGSQFTFGVVDGVLVCRSKSTILNTLDGGMFAPAIATVIDLNQRGLLSEGLIYFCEYLAKPKHNVLNYARVPKGFLVLYDVFRPDIAELTDGAYRGGWLNPQGKIEMANILGLEPVQVIFIGKVPNAPGAPEGLINKQSSLGGCNVEGIVIKNYNRPHGERGEGWPQTAKVVSDQFKEKMGCRPMNPKAGPGEFAEALIGSLRTENRWLKAVQHLREAGTLQGASADIGPLCREVQRDVLEEETEWIKQQLFDKVSKGIARGVVQGFAQWYQSKLANGWTVFEETEKGLGARPEKCTCEGKLPFPICECGAKENDPCESDTI